MKDEKQTATLVDESGIQPEIQEGQSRGTLDSAPQPEPLIAELIPPKKPVGEMSDQEVEEYYNIHLAGRNMGQMDTYELTLISRHGRIVAARRNDLEQQGEQAELLIIRQAIQVQANRQAMSAYLRECMTRSINDLRRNNATPELEIDFRFGNRVLNLKITDIFEAWNSKANTKTTEFERLVNLLLQLAAESATQRRNFINRTPNRDWTTQTNDINWSRIVSIFRNEDHAAG